MKLAIFASLIAAISAFQVAPTTKPTTSLNALATKADLKALATATNPVLNYYDPLELATTTIYGESNDAR